MDLQTHQLKAPLDAHITSIFHFRDFVPDHSIERVVPTGHVFLIFELDGFVRHTYDPKSLKANATFTRAWISGIHQHYLTISAHAHSEMFVVQFKATGAYSFLHVPMHALSERVLPAEEVLGQDVFELCERLVAAVSSVDKFQIAEAYLMARFDPTKVPPADLLDVAARLEREPVACFQEALEDYPRSHKHLIDQFRKYVGLRPKYYQRILRFNETLQEMQRSRKVSWTQVAYRCGYADQSHFIKEFRHFSGFNPAEFLKNDFDLEEGNFFPLDRHSD